MSETQGHDEALDYASRGWPVVPIKSGTKRPAISDWVREATTDVAQIDKWWSRPDVSGVGIATGEVAGFFVIDVDVGDGKRGDDTLATLEEQYGKLPDTVEAVTGGGGRHLLFRYPNDGQKITNAGKMGPGIDVRGDGGQIVAPGSIHPVTGNPYEWEASSHPDDLPIANAPRWLLDILRPPELVEREGQVSRDSLTTNPVAIAKFDATCTNEEVLQMLTSVGWTVDTQEGEVFYVRRPGKTEGYSASIGKVGPGVMYVFSTDAAPFSNNTPYDPTGVLAYTKFQGDIRATDAYLVEQGYGWTSYDFAPLWEAWDEERLETAMNIAEQDMFVLSDVWDMEFETPKPAALIRVDGNGAIYEDKVHAIVAEPESGKSWICGYLMSEQMTSGVGTLYWDFESEVDNYLYRLKLMGVTKNDAVGIAHYWRSMKITEAVINVLVNIIKRDNVKYVVIDSVNRIVTAMGLNYESGPDYVKFTNMVVDPIRKAGAAVILIDHVVKSKENRGRYAAGSEQKLSQVDVALHLEVVAQFAPGIAGTIGIRVAKDRLGGVKSDSYGTGDRRRWGLFHMGENSETGQKEITIEPWYDEVPKEAPDKAWKRFWPGQLMKAITDLLFDYKNGLDEDELDYWIEAKAAEKKFAMKHLIDQGYVVWDTRDGDGVTRLYHTGKGYKSIADEYSPEYDKDWKSKEEGREQ